MSRCIIGTDGRPEYWVLNDGSFVYEGINYEHDPYTDRYYRLDESVSLRPEMDGALVKHRISRKTYKDLLEKTIKRLERR